MLYDFCRDTMMMMMVELGGKYVYCRTILPVFYEFAEYYYI